MTAIEAQTYAIEDLTDRARETAIDCVREKIYHWVDLVLEENVNGYAADLGLECEVYFCVGSPGEYAILNLSGKYLDLDDLLEEVDLTESPPYRASELYANARAALRYARDNRYDVTVEYDVPRNGQGYRSIDIQVVPMDQEIILRHQAVEKVVTDRVEDTIKALLTGIEDELLTYVRDDYAYFISDEYAIEYAEEQEYRFNEDGRLLP
jgi:hypothetical protein